MAASEVIGSRPTLERPVPGAVVISTADNPHDPIQVTCEQTAPALWRPPRGRWSTIDRGGRIGLISYDGQDPYELQLFVRFDGYPGQGVEGSIRALESFAEVPDGQQEPPVLAVDGAIPKPHPNLKWRLTLIDDPADVLFLPGGKSRCRYSTTLTLTQHVTPDTLTETLKQTKSSSGLQTRTTRVQPGETTLYDVARRYYHNPARASEIAQANFKNGRPLSLGSKLTAGTQLRMPA